MKQKIGNWLLRNAYEFRHTRPWLLPACLGVLARLGLIGFLRADGTFLYFGLLVGSEKGCLRWSTKNGEIMYWYDINNDFYYDRTGGNWLRIVLYYLEDKLFDVYLETSKLELNGEDSKA